tara:strand:+ start:92 stop:613 length:522 start_codon:yes stop_codon:yes gene_type:complete
VEKNGKLVRQSNTTGTQYGARLDAVVEHQMKNWPTPRTQMTRSIQIREDGYHSNLEEAVAMMDNWPTATARDWKGSAPGSVTRKDGKSRMDLLDYAAEQSQLGPQDQANQTSGKESLQSDQTLHQHLQRRLNPSFVEWLMGVPIGWTSLKPLEMESYQLWWHSFSGDYSDVQD